MTAFKRCPKCRSAWPTRDAFLEDPHLVLVGYQVNFKTLTAGLLMFNHDCKTTLALPALAFEDLYQGPVFTERATGGDQCGGHCLHASDLAPCPAQCECAYIRHILQLIRAWPRRQAAGAHP